MLTRRELERDGIGELIGRLGADAKLFARAEIEVVKQAAIERVSGIATGAGLIVASIMIVQAALTVLLIALGAALAPLIGVALGIAAAGVVGLALAGLLGWIALLSIRRSTGGAG